MSIEVYYDRFRAPRVSRVCSLFQAAAFDTWERICFSRRTPGLKIHETTITQNIVYEMNLLRARLHIPNLFIYESRNEATNGNDIDFIVRQRGGRHYRYMIQSKILYHTMRRRLGLADGVYQQFPHLSGGQPQIDMLIRQARAPNVRAVPLYLLYNYVNPSPGPQTFCGIPIDGSQFGCSVVGAQLLQNRFGTRTGNLRRGVRFSQLHNGMALPWIVLACCSPRYTREQTLERFEMDRNYQLKDYTDDLRDNQGEWRLLSPYSASNQVDDTYKELTKGFSPRYRMVISG